jgi:hypothetical protein
MTREVQGVVGAATFAHQREGFLAFRVEVKNESTDRVEVDPQTMRFVTCDSDAHCTDKQVVVDPEANLVVFDEWRSRRQARFANAEYARSEPVLLGETATVRDVALEHRHPGDSSLLAMTDPEAAAPAPPGEDAQVWSSADNGRPIWSAALRRTTLLPGQAVGGNVYIPIAPEAKYVWLYVWTGGRGLWFPFEQAKIRRPESTTDDGHDEHPSL